MKYPAFLLFASFTVFSFTSCDGQKKSKAVEGKITTTIDSVSYGIGATIGRNLKKDGLDCIDVDLLSRGIKEVFEGKDLAITPESAQTIIQNYVQGIQSKKSEISVAAGKKFLEENAKK